MADDRELLGRIQALTAAMAEGQALPRSKMEPTVTDGYARALELDAECLRIERQIDALTEVSAEGRSVPRDEMSALLRRFQEATSQSAELRALLAPLRKAVSGLAA